MIRPHSTIPHVWELSRDPSFPRPHVGIIGALHGNEIAGLRAIERVREHADSMCDRLRRGSLILIHGNPRATAQRSRFSEGGTDINRLFAYHYVDDLAKPAWTYEHHRALELRPLIQGLDAMLDLHSASAPTVPFAICDGTLDAVSLAQKTGCRVTWGWDGPGMLMEHVSIGALVAAGRPAISVECGQHADPTTADVAFEVLTRFLGALEVSEHTVAERGGDTFELFGRVVKPTHTFELSQSFQSFDRLEPGQVLGRGEGVTITLEREAYLLLPTPSARRGEDIVYLARPSGRPSP